MEERWTRMWATKGHRRRWTQPKSTVAPIPLGPEAAIDMIIARYNPETYGEFGGRVITRFADVKNHGPQRRPRAIFLRRR
jgi:hypothetical protein